MQGYSNPKRADDPTALPDIETFYVSEAEAEERNIKETTSPDWFAGWWWWSCFPGCLPDSDPIGPFDTEALALADAQADSGGE